MANCTRDCHTFTRKLAFSHAISHALKAFDSPFSLTVPHRFFHARAVEKISFSSHPSLLNAWEGKTRGIAVFVRFRELSSFRNTITRATHGKLHSRQLHLPAKIGLFSRGIDDEIIIFYYINEINN